MSKSRFPKLLFGVALVVFVLDLWTKELVLDHIKDHYVSTGEPIVVIPGLFNLIYVQNSGAAMGILQGKNTVLLILTIVTLILLYRFRQVFLNSRPIQQVAFGLIFGGIIGNFLDRMRFGYVVDFLDFYWKSYHWYAFNIADSGICVGVALYLITSDFKETPWEQQKSPKPVEDSTSNPEAKPHPADSPASDSSSAQTK